MYNLARSALLKSVGGKTLGGSNPPLSAKCFTESWPNGKATVSKTVVGVKAEQVQFLHSPPIVLRRVAGTVTGHLGKVKPSKRRAGSTPALSANTES